MKKIDVSNVTSFLLVLLCINFVLTTFALLSNALQFYILNSLLNKEYDANILSLANFSDMFDTVISTVNLFFSIILAIVCAIWLHHAHRNIRRLGATGLKFTAASNIWWYVVPIASLFMPYKAMKEIWRASISPTNWQQQSTPSLLLIWWCVFILGAIIDNAVFRLSLKAESPLELYNMSIMYLASNILSLIVTPLFFIVVRNISKMQNQRAIEQNGLNKNLENVIDN